VAGAAASGAQRVDGGGGTFNFFVKSSVRAGLSFSTSRATRSFFWKRGGIDIRWAGRTDFPVCQSIRRIDQGDATREQEWGEYNDKLKLIGQRLDQQQVISHGNHADLCPVIDDGDIVRLGAPEFTINQHRTDRIELSIDQASGANQFHNARAGFLMPRDSGDDYSRAHHYKKNDPTEKESVAHKVGGFLTLGRDRYLLPIVIWRCSAIAS
jgi:hypothetical protein